MAALKEVGSQRSGNGKQPRGSHALKGRKLPPLYRNPKNRSESLGRPRQQAEMAVGGAQAGQEAGELLGAVTASAVFCCQYAQRDPSPACSFFSRKEQTDDQGLSLQWRFAARLPERPTRKRPADLRGGSTGSPGSGTITSPAPGSPGAGRHVAYGTLFTTIRSSNTVDREPVASAAGTRSRYGPPRLAAKPSTLGLDGGALLISSVARLRRLQAHQGALQVIGNRFDLVL